MGLLTVHGLIRLDQFWPNGSSDADTSKVKPLRFEYEGTPTSVFDAATVQGRGPAVPVLDRNGELTVRYQGIDAPELHYRPVPSKGATAIAEDYRQYAGESATVALHAHILELAGAHDSIPCKVRTVVERPNDVFDMYGRLIGDVWVAGRKLNRWLVHEGWAFPSLYASMTREDIESLVRAAKHANDHRLHIWSTFSDELHFNPRLHYRRPSKNDRPKVEPSRDHGPITMPKIFRRLAACFAAVGGVERATVTSYFEKHTSGDWWYATNEFIEQGIAAATPHRLAELVHHGRFEKRPEEIVFKEQPSRILAADGTPITSWNAE